MPIYKYQCTLCLQEQEINVPIEDRDEQKCLCGNSLQRKIVFTGLVYAKTANGGMK